jgi:E-phenylitaconyl-CoA hydratase
MSIDFELNDEGIAMITINRPERLNAMDAEHYRLLSEAWVRVRDDAAVRVAIITGAGERSFTAGADLKSFIPAQPTMAEMMLTQTGQLLNRGLEVWKPVISAINGFCVGGGMTLMLASDIRVAAEHAMFGVSEVKRGIFPANGGTQRIARQLPYAIAMEMLLVGDNIDSATAARWGLINAVVPKEKLMDTAFAYARRIAANAPLAVQAAKELAIRSLDVDLPTGLRLEQIMLRHLQGTQDVKEGTQAFAEKRAPKFIGA